MYVHMYICMYICTYHVRLIRTLMPGKHKYDKDKSNGDLLWHLCPDKFWIFRTVLIGEMCYILAAHCTASPNRLRFTLQQKSSIRGTVPLTHFMSSTRTLSPTHERNAGDLEIGQESIRYKAKGHKITNVPLVRLSSEKNGSTWQTPS